MIYLLDANVLIDANRDYYALERVPEFWAWVEHHAGAGAIKVPIEIYEEIKDGNDDLAAWIKQPSIKAALVLPEEADVSLVALAVNDGYAPDLTDDEIIKVGRDPFLMAYALRDRPNRCIVTTEVSKPSKQRANRHIPDVASTLGVKSCNTFDLTRALNFATSWRSSP